MYIIIFIRQPVVSNIKSSTVDGVAQCTFTRPNSIKRKISNDVEQDFNLQQSPFYIQYAGGKYEGLMFTVVVTHKEHVRFYNTCVTQIF